MLFVNITGLIFGIFNMTTAYDGTLNSAVIGWCVASLLMLGNTIQEAEKKGLL